MSDKEHSPDTVNEPDLSGPYTAADYLQWDLGYMVELIRGKVYKMKPNPSTDHQAVLGQLLLNLYDFAKINKYEFFHGPLDIYLVKAGQDYKETQNIVEPDLTITCNPDKIKNFGCVGSPDLIIEILSPHTNIKDQKDKFELYEEYGVREYWIVSITARSVILNVLENGKYKTLRPRVESETLQSVIFPELKVELKEVFKNVMFE
ncbi:MAG: Uma2 family endonuclease [Chitinophagales bacterium]